MASVCAASTCAAVTFSPPSIAWAMSARSGASSSSPGSPFASSNSSKPSSGSPSGSGSSPWLSSAAGVAVNSISGSGSGSVSKREPCASPCFSGSGSGADVASLCALRNARSQREHTLGWWVVRWAGDGILEPLAGHQLVSVSGR